MLFYVMAPSQDKSNLSYAWVIYSFVCFVNPLRVLQTDASKADITQSLLAGNMSQMDLSHSL